MRKTLFLLSIAVVSAALYAQTAASPQTSTGAPTPQEVQKAPPVQAASVSAELTKGVDTKHAKVGDELDAKTTAEAKLPDGTVLPKGTKLTGNVVEVAAKSKEQKNSHLVISLNRAVTKDGQDAYPLSSYIHNSAFDPDSRPANEQYGCSCAIRRDLGQCGAGEFGALKRSVVPYPLVHNTATDGWDNAKKFN